MYPTPVPALSVLVPLILYVVSDDIETSVDAKTGDITVFETAATVFTDKILSVPVSMLFALSVINALVNPLFPDEVPVSYCKQAS